MLLYISGFERECRSLWEEQLRDNLLQLAPTPHGLYLLYQTGALTDCLRSLYPRFLAKKQVSLLTQLLTYSLTHSLTWQ